MRKFLFIVGVPFIGFILWCVGLALIMAHIVQKNPNLFVLALVYTGLAIAGTIFFTRKILKKAGYS
tara:strand:- start:274 stop:471 length:198 start_codon:yes stop_codon:yes gene_type:complete